MPKPYSLDLRERVFRYVDEGHSCRAAAAHFSVGDPGPGDGETVRRFLVFLEDRRVLYNAMHLEVVSQVHHSIHEIREQ